MKKNMFKIMNKYKQKVKIYIASVSVLLTLSLFSFVWKILIEYMNYDKSKKQINILLSIF